MTAPAPIPTFALYGETDDGPDLVHVEAFSARSAQFNWRIEAHRHRDLCQFLWVEQGHAAVSMDARKVEVTAGAFVFIPAQVVHAMTFEPETDGSIFTFAPRGLGLSGPDNPAITQALSLPLSGPMTQELATLAAVLSTAIAGHGRHRGAKVRGLANALLACIAETAAISATQVRSEDRLSRLTALVRQHMAEGWSVSDYASALSVSAGHLSRLCRAATGTGAQSFVERVILDEACRYLVFTDLPVAEIGYQTGFSDPGYFSKRFRAAMGTAPRSYRAQAMHG